VFAARKTGQNGKSRNMEASATVLDQTVSKVFYNRFLINFTNFQGAIFALVILILSIYTCHRVQTHLSKKRVLSSQIRGYERVAPQRKSRVLKRSPTVSKIYEDRHQDLGTYRRIEIIGAQHVNNFLLLSFSEEEM